LNEVLAEKAALTLGLRLYRKSRKGSGAAFGPGRQAAVTTDLPTKTKAKFKLCLLDCLTALS
jgi:hypothetical protein